MNLQYESRKSINKFNKIFDLKEDEHCQDWFLECADENKLSLLIEGYDKYCEDDDDKFTLMKLILGSYESYVLNHGHSEKTWNAIRQKLQNDREIHKNTISYWSLWDENNDEDLFVLTKLMRKI
jgi:hypothetical protein